MKESAARMENIPSTMVFHKHVDGTDTRFTTISGPLANNNMVKCLRVIRRDFYQAAAEDSIWEYEPFSDLWIDIEPNIDPSVDGSNYEGKNIRRTLMFRNKRWYQLQILIQGGSDGVAKEH